MHCQQIHGWYGEDADSVAIQGSWPEEWLTQLKEGQPIRVNARKDRPGLFPAVVSALFIVPVHIRGEFWGFVHAQAYEKNFIEKAAQTESRIS